MDLYDLEIIAMFIENYVTRDDYEAHSNDIVSLFSKINDFIENGEVEIVEKN